MRTTPAGYVHCRKRLATEVDIPRLRTEVRREPVPNRNTPRRVRNARIHRTQRIRRKMHIGRNRIRGPPEVEVRVESRIVRIHNRRRTDRQPTQYNTPKKLYCHHPPAAESLSRTRPLHAAYQPRSHPAPATQVLDYASSPSGAALNEGVHNYAQVTPPPTGPSLGTNGQPDRPLAALSPNTPPPSPPEHTQTADTKPPSDHNATRQMPAALPMPVAALPGLT